MAEISVKELENSERVLNLLAHIDGISYEQQSERRDLFSIYESDTDLTAVLDVEEDVVVIFIPIMEQEPSGDLAIALLQMNDTILYGAFTLHDGKLFFKVNLAIENLDLNELEDGIRSVFIATYAALPIISIHNKKEI